MLKLSKLGHSYRTRVELSSKNGDVVGRVFSILGGEVTLMLVGGTAGLICLFFM